MKTRFKKLFIALALLGNLTQGVLAVVTFTNTPSAVSNTYSGLITLQIGGLTNKETVVVQKFLDLNTNGVIDGKDLLVQQFSLTDGTNFVIGGVTNFNVPGDLNATTGAITAQLNFQNGDFIQNLVGKYLFKLSSPVGHFGPITNQFAVTNFPFAQKFTGNVVSNSTSMTLSNAIVLLFPPPRPGNHGLGQPLGGTVANNAGAYTIAAPGGTYTLLAFYTNFVSNYKKAPVLILSNSVTVTTNLTVTNATASISGKVVDAANNALGLPGVFLPANSTNGLLGLSFTDTNGNFTARVTAGGWSLGDDDSGLIIHGYVGRNNSFTTNSGATGVTLAYAKANALIYGSVKDSLGNPLFYTDVNAEDNTSNTYAMDGYTGVNGNYVVGVLGLGGNDPWNVNANGSSGQTNYVFSQLNQNTNLNAGQAAAVNFTAILATNYIIGNLKNNKGTNLAGVGVSASLTLGTTNYQTSVDTDTNGNYLLNVANGTWNVSVNCSGGDDSLSALGSYFCPDGTNITIFNNNATNNIVAQLCGGVFIITPSPLPAGLVNTYYDQFIYASSCSSSFNWTNTSGANALPPGLAFGSNGELAGTPATNGVFTFNVKVRDGNNATTNQQFSVTFTNPPPLAVSTANLPGASVEAAYAVQLLAGGGYPPYTWSLAAESAALPGTLALSPGGLLSGVVYGAGTNYFTVQVTDNNSTVATQNLSLVVSPALPLISGPAVSGKNLQMTINGAPGQTYKVEYSTNLVNWILLLTTNPPSATPFQLNFPTTNQTGFYQVYDAGISVGTVLYGSGNSPSSDVYGVNPANGSVTIPVTATPAPTTQVCLNYTTVDGTAIGGIDYAPESGTVCFSPGSASNSIVIPVFLNPTNYNATFYVQLSTPDGSNALVYTVVIQNPRPVLAVYPTAMTIYAPGNCGPDLTISNAGPQGSVLNYALVDDGALGGYLNFNGQGPVSPATGSLLAGQSTLITITVLDQFATNWIGGTLTTAPNIYTPGAGNYVKYPLSVTISPFVSFIVDPVTTNDEEIDAISWIDVAAFDWGSYTPVSEQTIYGADGTANASAADVSSSVSSFASFTTLVGNTTISFSGSAGASANVTENYPPHDSDGYGTVYGNGTAYPERVFTLTCSSAASFVGSISVSSSSVSSGGDDVSGGAGGSAYCSLTPLGGSDPIFQAGGTNSQVFSFTNVLQAGRYYFSAEAQGEVDDDNGFGDPPPGSFNTSASFNVTIQLIPAP